MIIFDTETTGLLEPMAADIEKQPKIIEFAGIKIDDETNEEVSRLEFLVNPGVEITPQIIKITNINNAMVKKAKPFASHYQSLVDFFIGERSIVAHNCPFDVKVIDYELSRLDRRLNFPWPPIHICTVEKTIHILGERMSLGRLYKKLFDEEFKSAHRAMADVEALTRCVIELKKQGVL